MFQQHMQCQSHGVPMSSSGSLRRSGMRRFISLISLRSLSLISLLCFCVSTCRCSLEKSRLPLPSCTRQDIELVQGLKGSIGRTARMQQVRGLMKRVTATVLGCICKQSVMWGRRTTDSFLRCAWAIGSDLFGGSLLGQLEKLCIVRGFFQYISLQECYRRSSARTALSQLE